MKNYYFAGFFCFLLLLPLFSVAQELTREEKNTMRTCPLHNKHMPISDNYRANASDFVDGEAMNSSYPFAYQLSYRRYCNNCTRVMTKEAKGEEKQEIDENDSGGTFTRCEVHGDFLQGNKDASPLGEAGTTQVSHDVDDETPHAKQYLHRYYCKTCTKIHKINNKGKGKEKEE